MQRGPGGINCIEVVVFALATPIGAVWSVDFQDGDTGFGEMAGQTSTVGSGALDANTGQLAELGDPGQKRPVARPSGGETTGSEHCFTAVEDRGNVELFVGIDPGEDNPVRPGLPITLARRGCGAHAGHVVPFRSMGKGRHRASTEPADKTVMSTCWRRLSLGHPDGEA